MGTKYRITILLVVLAIIGSSCMTQSGPIVSDTEFSIRDEAVSATTLWGFYDIEYNLETGGFDIAPVRTAQFTANVVVFLQPPLGSTTNLGIHIIDDSEFFTQGLIDVNVTLTHPFPGLDKYTGFDVVGTFISFADTYSLYRPDVGWATGQDNALLLNPDGFTRWYNPVEFLSPNILGFVEGALGTKNGGFDATLNPYKYFCDGLGETEDVTEFFHIPANIGNRGSFAPGSNTRLYELKFPVYGGKPDIKFQYAVIASWEPPSGEPPYVLDDFPASANRAEAFHLSASDNGSDLYYTDMSSGGTFRFQAEIFDWGAMTNPEGLMGEVSQVVIESGDLDIPAGYVSMTPADFFADSTPSTEVSSIVSVELDGLMPKHGGEAVFLLTVESSNPDTYEQGFGVPVPDDPLASYLIFTIPILDENPCIPPVVSLTAPDTGFAGEDIEFDASGTTGTAPIAFDWDWDGDGTYDETTYTAITTHVFEPGIWNVGLRVSNECGEDILEPMHEITIICPDEVHSSYLGIVSPTGDFSDLRQDGTAFLPDGRLLVKRQDSLVAVNVSVPGNPVPDVIISDLANCGYSGGMWTYIVNLDYDEAMDRILYSVQPSPGERITVYDDTGSYITQFDVPNSGGEISGLDTDDQGGVWAIYHTPGGTTGTNTLYHYEWDSGLGDYVLNNSDTIDCTFIESGARGIFDLAVMPSADRLYVFHQDSYPYRGSIWVFDIGQSPPVHLSGITKQQVFDWTGNVGAAIGDYYKWEGGSIEVDNNDLAAETCRIIVQHCFQSGGDGIGLMKFDQDLNVLDTYRRTGTRLSNLSIYPSETSSGRLIAMPTWTHGACDIYVFEAPAGW